MWLNSVRYPDSKDIETKTNGASSVCYLFSIGQLMFQPRHRLGAIVLISMEQIVVLVQI
jgi:hypothetical protein